MDVWVLMSGGVDSTACAHYFVERGDNVCGIFVDYGQAAAVAEFSAVQSVTHHLGIPLSTMTFRVEHDFGAGEILGRNAFLVFAAMMGVQPKLGVLSLGVHSGTGYYDCGIDFFDRIGHIVDSYSLGRIALLCPFLKEDKAFVFRYVRAHNIPLHITYSCEMGTNPPCGRCLSCGDRDAIKTR